jgi:uncharacterized protein YqjF (DUF2071 family)
MANTFLRAEWRKLLIASYTVDQSVLNPYLPANTELDLWKGTCYVSLVGFMFLNTKVKGFRIPGHVNFEEVNLRFYVRYNDNGTWKRGVVFIKEIVPKASLTFVANALYHEHYETLPMEHKWAAASNDTLAVEYKWKKNIWHSITALAEARPVNIDTGSEEEFITEHYWGYTKINDHKTSEYEVKHPKWQVYPVKEYEVNVDFKLVYGEAFQFLSTAAPVSVFLAEGSEISVHEGRRI